MKFSFDFENYRKNLANEVKEKKKESKEKAKDILENEQQSERYNVAKEIKRIDFEIQKINPTLHEIATIDVANRIPENLKLLIDKRRIWEITDGKPRPDGVSEFITSEEEINELKNFVNEITENNFFDKRKINTVIQAYGGTLEGRSTTSYSSVSIPKEKAEGVNKLRKEKRGENNYNIQVPENRQQLNPDDLVPHDGIYFDAGDNHWLDMPTKTLLICDPFSKRFLEKASFVSPHYCSDEYQSTFVDPNDSDYDAQDFNRYYEKAIEYAGKYTEAGISIMFKKGVRWIDIAEWIVDLPNGKIYRITDKENPQI